MAKKKTSQKRIPNILYLLLTFVFITFLLGLFFYYTKNGKQPNKLEKVKVSLVWLHQAQFAGVYTAIEKGFYEDAGLEVELEEFEFGKQLEQDLVDGKTDFSILHADRLLESIGKGLDVKAVAAIYQTSPHAFVADKSSSLSEPDDLRGKVLGIKGDNTSAKILYSVLLSELGLSYDEVIFKPLDFSTHEFEDIKSGSVDLVDLYRTDQVYFFEQNEVDYQLIPPENFRFDMYGDVITTSGEKLKKNPKLVQKFVDATIKGWEYAVLYPDEAVNLTLRYVKSEDYRDWDYNKFILENSLNLIVPDDGSRIGHMQLNKWNSLYNVMKTNNFFDHDFDYSEAFTLEFIDQ